MISVDEAKEIISRSVTRAEIVDLPLAEAHELTLAHDIVASIDIPNFFQSSMDGYAIRFEDRQEPLRIIGEMAAGTSHSLAIAKGEAARIFTGAPLPYGADTVVIQEKVNRVEDRLFLADESMIPGQHVRPKGAEVKQGEVAMAGGTKISAAALGFLAGIGRTHVPVFVPPSVGIVLTGNELQEPGKALQFGQVYEANSVQLIAALKKTGIVDIKTYRAPDDRENLADVLHKALAENNVVLLNGGVSVGDYDFVTTVAQQCGVFQKFHKIRQKPGKPLFFGLKDNQLVFGLPGNPSSSLTCFYEYVLPAIEKAMNKTQSMITTKAFATHDYVKPVGLTHFLKAHYSNGSVAPLHAQESFRLHSFAQANCLIVLPESSAGCIVGDEVEVHLLPL